MTETELLPEHEILAYEFDAWQARNPDRICCEGREVTEDGRLVFYLSIGDTKFRLLCPVDYPNHEDSFFMETECADFWCVALNEFVVDHPDKLKINDILAKTILYYTPSSRKKSAGEVVSEMENESDSENEDYRCGNLYCSDDFECGENAEWESTISKKKREWREKEGELRLKYNRPKISDMFDGVSMEHPQQVFSNSGASAILVNDLINIMGSRESGGIVVEPIESDICRWSVLLKNFAPESTMAKDLHEINELYGYEHVQLQLDFAMDLYPFHPPLLRLVKPKLIGIFDEEEFVQLANWNPARDMASVLKEIKIYIEANGAIDIYNRNNGVDVARLKNMLDDLTDALKSDQNKASDARLKCTGTEHSAWISSGHYNSSESSLNLRKKSVAIETILARVLYQLKNVARRTLSNSQTKTGSSYFTFNLSVNENFFDEKNAQPTSKSSSYSSLILNAVNRLFVENEKFKTHTRRMSLTSQKSKDIVNKCGRNICNIIANPSFDFDYHFNNAVVVNVDKYTVENNSANKVNGFLNDIYTAVIANDSDESEKKKQRFFERANDVVSTFNPHIKTSQGSPATSTKFGSDENSSRVSKILRESNLIPLIRSRMKADAFFEIWLSTSLHSMVIEILIEIARNQHLIDLLKPTEPQDRSIADLVEFQGEIVGLIFAILSDIADRHAMKQADLDKVELAKSLICASKLVLSKIERTNYWGKKSTDQILSEPNNVGINDRLCPVNDCPESVYRNSLKHLQFRDRDIDPKGHAFENEYKAETNLARNYFQIAQEFAFLSKTMPLSPTPAIFIIMDSSKCSLIRALIIGGEETTSCSGGCFNFDIYLRKDYPDCQIGIKCTTFPGEESIDRPRSGRIFIPFEGDALNPDTGFSNLQFSPILKTLSSLRNNKFPFVLTDGQYTRPNCKSMKVTDGIISDQVLLTDIIRCSMIDQMRNPPPGFEEVIKTHFRLKKDRIISELTDKHEFLRNSEILHLLIEEFDKL